MKKSIKNNTNSVRRPNFTRVASRSDDRGPIKLERWDKPGSERVNYNDRYLLDNPKWENDDTEEMLELVKSSRSKY